MVVMDARVLWPRGSFINHGAEMKRLFSTSGRGKWPRLLFREAGKEMLGGGESDQLPWSHCDVFDPNICG